ncbi:hypothetical protein LAZ67_X004717, partial [Cordylochernes scorpioides]
MAASDMRNRHHVQLLLTWSTDAAHPEIKDLESEKKAIVESKNIHGLKLFQQEVNERKISLNQVINTLLESELDDTQYDDYSKAKKDIFNMLVSIEEALSLIETKENTHSDKQLPESNVNLPKINLPIFNGDSANWLSFREIFNSTINSNQTLTEIQKFQYLNASVKGPAEKLIRGFPISDKNYQQAWDTLCNRFNNRRELAFSQINKIFSIRPLKSISAGSLYEILDVCNEGIRNLSVLGLEKNTLTDLILINFFEKRIGEALRKEWELTLQNEEYPTFEKFVNFLEKHARSLQGMRIPLFQEQKTSSKNMMAHGLYVNKGQNCILCHQIHKLNDCQRFINLPLPKKWELVKKHKLCQNCLRANHEISKCLITSRCKNCKQNHHTLLHEYNSEPSIPQPTTSQEMLISTNTICNAMPLETETNILLSTALIKVKAKDGSFVLCRALVDNGSQISLISEQCCHKLGLEKRKNSYTLKGVGDIVVNKTTSQVEIEFTPHHNDQLFSARAFVVGRVTADLPNFQIQSADFPHLENLLLADPEFYVTKPIDLILGADTFVEIILGHKTDLKHHPIALNTKLGWLVSGRIHSTIKSNTSVINHCTTELDSSIRKFWELEDVPISKAQLGIKNAPSPSLQESIQTSPSLPDSVQGSPSLTLSLQSSKHNSPTPLQVSVHSLKEAMSPLVEMPSSPGCSKQIPIPIEEDSIESQNRVDNLPSYPMSPEQSYTLSSASVEDFKAQSGPKSPTSTTRGSESYRCSGDYTEPQMSQNSNFLCSSIEESEDNSSKSEENLSRSEDNPSKSEEIPSKSKKSRISKLTPQITSKQNQLLPSESSQPSTPEQPLASQSSEPLSSKKETSIIPKIKPPPYYRRKRQLPAEKTSWDEPIESDIKSNWNKFQTQLSCLKEIKIPRYLNSSSSEIEELQLHGFCDASLNAYSAVFYLKTRFKIQKIKINLITSKTKVAPLKTITIPRLELSAALLLAQLNQVILESYPFQPDKTFLWTDSQICIDWIRSDASRWKAFVSNRVSSIQNLTQITDWFHVSSQDNPADCASRGIMPQDLVNHRIWWRGPIWLQENNVRYIPSSPTQVNLNIIQEEVGEGQVLDQTTLIQNSETMLNLEFIVRYSTMTKLIRITAWCWRFYYNCLLFDPIRQKGPLTTRELTKAIQVLVKSIQQVEFCTEIKLLKSNKQLPLSNKLTSLNPFLDTQGLLRVGGRLKYSYLNENQKFPLLQPKSPRQESLIKNLLTENADIPEAIDENQEDSSILETTFVIEDEESNKDIGTTKIEISEVSVIDKSEGKYSKEPVVSVEALDKKELCHDDSAHLNVVEADLNRPKEATSGIINVYTEANESSSKEKVVPVEIVDTSTKDYLQSGEKAKLSRWKPIDSLCLEDVKESEDDDENYSSSAYIEWPEILKKEVLRPETLEKAVNLEDFEKAAESRQLSKEHLEESTEQGSCIKAESKPWEDPIESDLAAVEANHEISKCLITSRCKNCKQNHHTLLHEYNSEPSIPQPTTSQEMLISTNTICNAMPLETETNILLSTALIKVKAKDGSFVLCRALVDNGSQISLISEQCCHKLGLEKRKNSYTLKGVGDIVVNRTTSQVEIEFTPHHNDQLFSARAFVVGRVTADLPNFQIQSADFPHLENLLLADPEFYVTKPIDLILGADTFVEIILGHKTDLKHHPIALNTKLGWLVSGRIHSTIKSNTSVINHCTTELDSSIRKFWELEDVPISKAQLGTKNACEILFKSNLKRDIEGRYSVNLPFKSTPNLGDSRSQALEKGLQENPSKSEDNSSKSEENLSRSEDNPSKSEEIPSKSKKSRISKLTPQITSKQNQLLPSESSQPSTPEQPLASQSSEPLSSKKETSIIPKIKPPPYYRRKRQLPAEKTSWDEPIESDTKFKIQKIKINLITSKTKVAPLKTITIPRLELSAALRLAQLNQVILESFPFQPDKTFLWTDSQICIDWIRSDASRWKAFVSNRVSSIQNLTQITDWFHVSSQDNPADCASRGIMPQDLVNHRIWWRGPIWLQENNVRYIPSSPTQVNLNIIQEEVGEGQVLDQTTLIQNSETMLNLEFIVRYSTMTKLIRITAWCWRFYYNCLLFDPIRQKGPLTTRELTKAIQVLVKSIQQVEFCTEIKLLKSNKQLPLSNKLTSLNPFLDTQGLLRVGGRLKYSYLNENQKFPLLQPKSPRQESLIKNLLTENADIPEAIDENQEDSSILETTFVIEDEESNKDIGTPKIEISEVSVIDKSEGKYSKEPVVSVEALDKKELCHDDSAHLNVVEADLNRPKEATSGIINVYTEANESSSKEKVVPVEIVDTSTKDYLQSGEKAKLSRWKPIDSLCLEDVKESEDDDENYSSSAYIEWPEILKKEVLRPEALEKAVNLEDFEKAAESRQLSKEHLEESTEQGSCIKAESKPWEDPIESDLAAA